jgi:nucleoside 2-deoxyribosyltransferase
MVTFNWEIVMAKEKIYVASSWRNYYQIAMVAACRAAGFEAYDFKDSEGFKWDEVDPKWEHWDYEGWQKGLCHERAEQGFKRDMDALEGADRCILVLPSGRSAHLEAGYAIGKGKPTAIWVPEYDTPDLMVKMADYVSDSLMDILGWLGVED